MFINVDGVIMNKEYIGYAYVYKKDENKRNKWVLHVRFMNENVDRDYIEMTYETKKEAEAILRKMEEELV